MLRSLFSHGVWYSLGIAINRIVPERLFRFRIFRVYELGVAPDDSQVVSDDSITFRWCESPQDYRAAEQQTYFRPLETSSRHKACLALDGTHPIGGVWCACDAFEETELGVRLILGPDQAWIFAAHVAKSHRRRGIYRRLLNQVLRMRPGSHYLASINPTNKASMAAHRPFIQRTSGTCLALRIGSRTACWAGGDLSVNRYLTTNPNKPIEIELRRREPCTND